MSRGGLPSRDEIREYLLSFDLFEKLGRPEEGRQYVGLHLDRLIRSVELMPVLEGGARVLELGASPYFMTLLIERYLGYAVTPANFFADYGAAAGETFEDRVSSARFGESHTFRYQTFNIERDPFPFADASFDLVLCCEILEHLAMDPSHTLREMHRVLKPGGHVFFSTPNVLSLEYVRRLLRGRNIYNPYSGYGVYGRHNREYTSEELAGLLREHHFEPIVHVEDVYPHDRWHRWLTRGRFRNRRDNLFAVGKAYGEAVRRYPAWLYSQQWGRPKVARDSITMGDGDVLQLGAGGHDLEDWPPSIRWTGREAVAYLSAPGPGHTALKMRAWGGPQGTLGRVVFRDRAGQEAYPTEAFSLEGGGPWEIAVPLPAGLGGGELLEVRLVVDRPFVPGPEDRRELGVAGERLWWS